MLRLIPVLVSLDAINVNSRGDLFICTTWNIIKKRSNIITGVHVHDCIFTQRVLTLKWGNPTMWSKDVLDESTCTSWLDYNLQYGDLDPVASQWVIKMHIQVRKPFVLWSRLAV